MKSGLLYTGRMRNEEKRGISPDGVLLTYFCLVVPAVLLNIMMGLNIGKKWQWILVNDWIQGMFSFNNVNVSVVSNSCLQCALISQVSWIKIICTSFQSFLLNGLIWGIKIWLRASPASCQHLFWFWFNACYCSYQRFWYMNEDEARRPLHWPSASSACSGKQRSPSDGAAIFRRSHWSQPFPE